MRSLWAKGTLGEKTQLTACQALALAHHLVRRLKAYQEELAKQPAEEQAEQPTVA